MISSLIVILGRTLQLKLINLIVHFRIKGKVQLLTQISSNYKGLNIRVQPIIKKTPKWTKIQKPRKSLKINKIEKKIQRVLKTMVPSTYVKTKLF